ncbi:hypothetical protein U9M48_032527, partial [Paspalum notatum var. saurae]
HPPGACPSLLPFLLSALLEQRGRRSPLSLSLLKSPFESSSIGLNPWEILRGSGGARMARYRLVDEYYEKDHRARRIEDAQDLPILRCRTHDGFQLMRYDHRYTPLLKRAGLHVVANLVRRGMPTFNPAALTALTDRWRPETHSFHLPCGEMTITLEDVAMLLGLPIRGQPVTGAAVSDGWRARVQDFLGTELPPAPAEGRRGRVSGVLLSWLRARFGECPDEADHATVTYHCRAWVLHMFGSVLFPDGTGDSASWMYIHCLRDWDDAGQYNWGSAVLAFLYRQLCEACRRHAPSSTMAGCTFLLQIWMWSRLPVGRPQVFTPRAWEPFGVPDLYPTVAYIWENVSAPYAITKRAYVEYSNELDALNPSTVAWEPYTHPKVQGLPLNTMCVRDSALFRMRCPLICFYAVEVHLPHRVARQFELMQDWPPEEVSTSIQLHKFDRVRQRKVTDFAHHHRDYIDCATRYKLRQKWTTDDYADMTSSDDEDTTFDQRATEGTQVEIAPILDRVGTSVRQSVDDITAFLATQADVPHNTNPAMELLQKLKRRLSRVANRCGCWTQSMHDIAMPALSHRSGDSAQKIGHASVGQSTSPTPTFSGSNEDVDEEDYTNDASTSQDVLNSSQLPDAPPPTQPSQRVRRTLLAQMLFARAGQKRDDINMFMFNVVPTTFEGLYFMLCNILGLHV